MSATNRGLRERLVDDAYETPAWVTHALIKSNPFFFNQCHGLFFEPCAGSGAIIKAVRELAPPVFPSGATSLPFIAVEKRAACRKELRKLPEVSISIGDFLKWRPDNGFPILPGGDPEVAALITNPPFSLAMEFIEHSIALFPRTPLYFLLRLNFLESQKRAAFFREYMPDVYVLPKRPSFTGRGTDATGYGWFCWPVPLGGYPRVPGRVQGTVQVLPL